MLLLIKEVFEGNFVFFFIITLISSVPGLWLKKSVPEMPCLLSSFQTAKTILDWLQCVAKGLLMFIVLQIFNKLLTKVGLLPSRVYQGAVTLDKQMQSCVAIRISV